MRRAVALVCAVGCLPAAVLGAAREVPLDHYIVKTWSWEQGAPTGRINGLVEGSDGFLWMATYEGLIRFDGVEHRVFNHQDHPALVGGVLNILESPAGSFWMVSTAGNLIRLRAGHFTVWTAQDGFPSERGEQLVSLPTGGPLFYGRGSYWRVDEEDRIVPFPTPGLPASAPITMAFDEAATLWVAPTEGGLWSFRDGHADRFDPSEAGAPGNRVNGVFPQPDGSIWLGMDRGVARFEPAHGYLRFFEEDEFWVHDRNLRMAQPGGPLLLGGNTLGSLHSFSPDGIRPFRWGPLREPTETVNALAPLRDGGFAIGTYSQGLLILVPASFPFFNRQNGLEGVLVNAIRPYADGRWLVAHNLGVDIFDGRTFEPLDLDGQPFRDYTVDILEDSRGRLWVGTFGRGLFLREGDQWRSFGRRAGLRSNTIRALAEDRAGNVWIGTRNGLYRWNESLQEFYGTAEGLRSDYILSLYVDREDRLWIGTARGGVHRLTNGRVEADEGGPRGEFANRTIFAISADREGRVWGGMSGGVFQANGDRIEYLNLYESLDVDSVYHVTDDGIDAFWLTSSQGLFRVPYDDLLKAFGRTDRLDARTRHFNRRNGLPTDAMRPVSRMHRDEAGRLWFPTENGFFVLDPANLPVATSRPRVYFDRLRVNEAPHGPPWYFDRLEDTLAPRLRRIRFDYVSPHFQLLDREFFRIRLRGFEKDWRVTRLRSVEYTNLAPGAYVFEVAAGDGLDLWGDPPASFAFEVRPALHETIWFHILLILTLILGVGALVRRRTWVLRRREAELVALVDERTRGIRESEEKLARSNEALRHLNEEKNQFLAIAAHDLRNPIGAIEGAAQLIESEMDDLGQPSTAESVRECLHLIYETTRRMSALIGNLLDIHRIEQGQTVARLAEVCAAAVAEGVLHSHRGRARAKGIDLHTRFNADESRLVCADPDLLAQVLDNLLSNAIKFSPPGGSVELTLEEQGERLRLSVKDSGPGIPAGEEDRLFKKFARLSNQPTNGEGSTGLGLSIAKQLAEIMGGNIGCESEPGSGARFWVELPWVTPDR